MELPDKSQAVKGLKGAASQVFLAFVTTDGLLTNPNIQKITGLTKATVNKALFELSGVYINEIQQGVYILNNIGRELVGWEPIEELNTMTTKEHPGFIYFITSGNYVKIGYAKDPRKRAYQIQTGNPEEITLVGAIEGTKEDERLLQIRFAKLHYRNEWYLLDGELTDVVQEAKKAWKKNFFPTTAGINLNYINQEELKAVVPENFSRDVYELLKSCGIGEPMLSRLSSMDHVTTDYASAHIEYWRTEKKAPAMLIHRLRNNDPVPEFAKKKADLPYEPDRYTKGKYSDIIQS